MVNCKHLGKGNKGVCYNEDCNYHEQDCPEYMGMTFCDKHEQEKTKAFIIIKCDYKGSLDSVYARSTFKEAVEFCRKEMGDRCLAFKGKEYFQDVKEPKVDEHVMSFTDGSYGSIYRIYCKEF